jgi:hypothetical protein
MLNSQQIVIGQIKLLNMGGIKDSLITKYMRAELNKDFTNMLKNYFGKKLGYRGSHYAQLKVEVMRDLRKKGFKVVEIAEIVYGSPNKNGSVSIQLNRYVDSLRADEIRSNMYDWISKGLYPVSKRVDYRAKDGTKVTVMELELLEADQKIERRKYNVKRFLHDL